jgi:TonB family protein
MDDNGKSAELIAPNVLAGKAISKPEPEYPWLAQLFERSGEVAVDVVIDESGKVVSAKAVIRPMLLKRASVDAAYKAQFTPTLLSGQPTKVKGLITYKFRLE